jgi:hypothetical protein
MNRIQIGLNPDGQPVFLTPELRTGTHMHVIGGSGTGKSKFLEWLIRQDILEGHGFCVIDWHGELYNNVLRYCAQLEVGLDNDFRKLILLNPSHPDFITGFNPFMNPGQDITVQVNNRVGATIKPWGMENTDQTPLLRRILAILFYVAAKTGEPLPSASQLLRANRSELREYALKQATDRYYQDELEWLNSHSPRDWNNVVLSSENRIGKFLGSSGIRRFMGLKDHNIDLRSVMDEGAILLVNLGASQRLDRESAKVFASLLLHQFFETAMDRANEATLKGEKPNHFILYLDEFQEYITDDIAAMLDQVRKGGIHMVLSHQILAHLLKQPTLLESVMGNARIRAVFGGLPVTNCQLLAEEMFLPDLNERQIKKAYYHTIHTYEEQTRTTHSQSQGRSQSKSRSNMSGKGTTTGESFGEGSGLSKGLSVGGAEMYPSLNTEGWFTESGGESNFSSKATTVGNSDFNARGSAEGEANSTSMGQTIVPVWVPIPVQELGSETEYTPEEKRLKIVELLKCQMKQHCFIKMDTAKTQPLLVPFVKDFPIGRDSLIEYEEEVYKEQDALPAEQVDALIVENEQRFLAEARQVIDITPERDAEEAPARPSRSSKPRKPKSNLFANATLTNSSSNTDDE